MLLPEPRGSGFARARKADLDNPGMPICLRACYAKPSTSLAYGTIHACDVQYWPRIYCYLLRDAPVLSLHTVLCNQAVQPTTYNTSQPTPIRAVQGRRADVWLTRNRKSGMVLRRRYAMSGTDVAHVARLARVCYAISGPDIRRMRVLGRVNATYGRPDLTGDLGQPYSRSVLPSYLPRRVLRNPGKPFRVGDLYCETWHMVLPNTGSLYYDRTDCHAGCVCNLYYEACRPYTLAGTETVCASTIKGHPKSTHLTRWTF
eukprot:3816079-Rhodomonas_salina.5